jgi:hypothetical protein
MSEGWGGVSWERLRLGMVGVVMERVGDAPDMVADYTGRYGRVSRVSGEIVCGLDARQQWVGGSDDGALADPWMRGGSCLARLPGAIAGTSSPSR